MVNTLQEARDTELRFRLKKRRELVKLSLSGNTFAKHELKCLETGLKVNLEALLPDDCSHAFETPFGHRIPLRLSNKYTTNDGFQVRDIICPICGKTLEKTVRKAKQDTRGC